MNDVARLAAVSLKTVSRVVNDEPGVNPKTAERVRVAIDQLGFRRNLGARNLRRGTRPGLIGVITEDVSNPFYSALVRAVEEVARSHERHVLTASSEEDPTRERELVLNFCARQVDGLVIVPAGPRHGYLAREVRAGTAVVFVDRPAGDLEADTVLLDNYGGMIQAVRHLARRGHRRIGFLGDAVAIFTARERLRGFRDGCTAAGTAAAEELIAMGPHDIGTITDAIDRMLSLPDPATAFITGNNRITVLALTALARFSRKPALVAFDDFELATLLEPPVTVISYDTATMGRTAAELLFARLARDQSPPRRITIPVQLIERGSGEVRP